MDTHAPPPQHATFHFLFLLVRPPPSRCAKYLAALSLCFRATGDALGRATDMTAYDVGLPPAPEPPKPSDLKDLKPQQKKDKVRRYIKLLRQNHRTAAKQACSAIYYRVV